MAMINIIFNDKTYSVDDSSLSVATAELKSHLSTTMSGTGATINLDTLAANAPAEGWTALTNITNMFCYSPNVTGSRSAFLAKCPADVTGASGAFTGTNTTE
jgi:hypothetical protein